MATIEVSAGEAMSRMTFKVVVTGRRRTIPRAQLGVWMIRLAAKVMGCNIEIVMSPHADADTITAEETVVQRAGGMESRYLGCRVTV